MAAITITGATGLIGKRLIGALSQRGDTVTVLSRDASKQIEGATVAGWDPMSGPAPATALSGRDAVVHLAGEPVAQRWNAERKQAILESRETGTRNLVAGIAAADDWPSALIAASAVGYYGPRGDEVIDEATPPGSDFLAGVCVAWERESQAAAEHGLRVVQLRTGVVLDKSGGALAKMLPPFKAGAGGPVAGGRQYMPWIHVDDVVGMYVAAIDDTSWSGAYNASAPQPVTNAEFSKALGRALHRPAFAPAPAFALKILFGEMAEIVTTGQRAVPAHALADGYAFAHADLDEALASALS
jgi:uncharacterized protein (TIGR01777 family)